MDSPYGGQLSVEQLKEIRARPLPAPIPIPINSLHTRTFIKATCDQLQVTIPERWMIVDENSSSNICNSHSSSSIDEDCQLYDEQSDMQKLSKETSRKFTKTAAKYYVPGQRQHKPKLIIVSSVSRFEQQAQTFQPTGHLLVPNKAPEIAVFLQKASQYKNDKTHLKRYVLSKNAKAAAMILEQKRRASSNRLIITLGSDSDDSDEDDDS